MAKNCELQLTFDFQLLAARGSECANPASKPPEIRATEHLALFYCLEDRRAAKLAKEAAVHYSAILSLVAHIK